MRAWIVIQSLLTSAGSIDKDSRIYIDSDLGDGIKGEVESEKLHFAGFTKLFLATGFDKLTLSRPVWICEIYPKDPKKV